MLRDATKYPQPDMFDAFRFADPSLLGRDSSLQPEGSTKFTDINEKWHVWGTGKLTWYVHIIRSGRRAVIHALANFTNSPGRFFVSYVMKHVMYHILENYEPEMEQQRQKYTVNWRTLTLPGPGVKANFKRRVDT